MNKLIQRIFLSLITTISLPLIARNITETKSGNEIQLDQQRVYAETVIENDKSEAKIVSMILPKLNSDQCA